MNKETLKTILQLLAAIITALLTTLGAHAAGI
jgi:hypothetical protein